MKNEEKKEMAEQMAASTETENTQVECSPEEETTPARIPVHKAEQQIVTIEMPSTEALGNLHNMRTGKSLMLRYKTAEDWALLKGQEIRVYYVGMRDVPDGKGELVRCGIFVNEKENFISGQKTLVDAVQMLPVGTAIAITYQGKQTNKSNGFSTMIFDVVILL